MKNIFNELPHDYFDNKIFILKYLKYDLHSYLNDNLHDENNKFRRDLRIALKTNVNGKYI
jgi:hypothetical protein